MASALFFQRQKYRSGNALRVFSEKIWVMAWLHYFTLHIHSPKNVQ